MTNRIVQLEQLKARSIEDILREVAEQNEILTVKLANGEAITIQPSSLLKPLPALQGHLPQGWKDAIRK